MWVLNRRIYERCLPASNRKLPSRQSLGHAASTTRSGPLVEPCACPYSAWLAVPYCTAPARIASIQRRPRSIRVKLCCPSTRRDWLSAAGTRLRNRERVRQVKGPTRAVELSRTGRTPAKPRADRREWLREAVVGDRESPGRYRRRPPFLDFSRALPGSRSSRSRLGPLSRRLSSSCSQSSVAPTGW